MNDTKQCAEDPAILEQLDLDYIHSDTYQKREGDWVCVAACALDPVPVA